MPGKNSASIYHRAPGEHGQAAGPQAPSRRGDPRRPKRSASYNGGVKLHYTTDAEPGIRRIRSGSGFRYETARGRSPSAKDLARIRALAIPPAYTNVWISSDSNSYLQATGRDARGRKQYRYHPDWTHMRSETKYHRMSDFGCALPHMRRRVSTDLARQGLTHEKVLATIVYLLEHVLIRVGNEEYAKENHSYGLTTLEDRHVVTHGDEVLFRFRGKSGVHHEVEMHDPRVAKVIRACQDLPGQRLFEYRDDAGAIRHVESGDVNAYIHAIAGDDFTAKDFRTWGGTVGCCAFLRKIEVPSAERAAAHCVTEAIEAVAERLGNTVAVCRKSYIHPAIPAAFLSGALYSSSGSSEAVVLDILAP
jgi:DNA topoisomerase I